MPRRRARRPPRRACFSSRRSTCFNAKASTAGVRPSPCIQGRWLGLFPRGVDRLAYQESRVRTRARPEFLNTPAVYFGDVEISFLIDAEPVHSPKAARKVAPRAEGIQEVS